MMNLTRALNLTRKLNLTVKNIKYTSTTTKKSQGDRFEYIPGVQGYAPGFGPPSLEENQYYKTVQFMAKLKRYKKFVMNTRLQKRLQITKDRAKIACIIANKIKIGLDRITFSVNEDQKQPLVYSIKRDGKELYIDVSTSFLNIKKEKEPFKVDENDVLYKAKLETVMVKYENELNRNNEIRSKTREKERQKKEEEEISRLNKIREATKYEIKKMESEAFNSSILNLHNKENKEDEGVMHLSGDDHTNFKKSIEKKQSENKDKLEHRVKIDKISTTQSIVELVHLASSVVTPKNIEKKLEEMFNNVSYNASKLEESESVVQKVLDRLENTKNAMPTAEYYLQKLEKNIK